MQIDVYESAIEAACAAADLIAQRIYASSNASSNIVLGLATGSTMEPLYHYLIERHVKAGLTFRFVTTFNLDEYIGLMPTHPASYRATMHRLLFKYTDIAPNQIHLPNGMSVDPDTEANLYETSITKAGGIDLQLIGIGRNGHIAFNEPGTSFASRTHVVNLDGLTRTTNARFFPQGEHVPDRAITMGISTILESREILLVVTGSEKQLALSKALLGEVNPECPASVLQLHPNVKIFADRASASEILPPKDGFDKICLQIGCDNIRLRYLLPS